MTYVETHGTATALGDPIEFKALTKAFRASTQTKTAIALRVPPRAIGSVKTNICHLDVAFGIAGLLKTVLAPQIQADTAQLALPAAQPGN